ncbi:MAG: hypothetical protein GY778_02645, partial [bacterium]|nr:hypothetical protein [bacterium]
MGLWKSISAALGLTPRRKRPPDLYKSGVFPWHDHGPGTWQCCPRDVEGPVAQPIDIRVKTTALLPNSRLIPQDAGQQQQLAQLRLPVLQSLDDLLAWLGLDGGPFLALANPSDRARPNTTTYIEWTVPKKRGGVRIISSPKPRLKAVQYHVQRDILARVAPHEAAHGFVPGRNIFSNAAPHVGQALVMNLDLRHFFHYVTYPRVVGVFRWLGYSQEVSRGLAL